MNVLHFIYLLAPISFFAVNKHLTNRDYFNFVAKFENSKSLLKRVFIYGLFFLCLGATMLSATAFQDLLNSGIVNILLINLELLCIK